MSFVRLVNWANAMQFNETRIVGYTVTVVHMFTTDTTRYAWNTTIAEFSPIANNIEGDVKVIISVDDIPDLMVHDGNCYIHCHEIFKRIQNKSEWVSFIKNMMLGVVCAIIPISIYYAAKNKN